MRFQPFSPPREFVVGRGEIIRIRDCGRLALDPDEQVTLTTEAGGEYDVARKAWGFYATPSLNSRLPKFGLRAAMSRNPEGRYFIFLVERGREAEFFRYLEVELNVFVSWLDNDVDLALIAHACEQQQPRGQLLRCLCGGEVFTSAHVYDAPPAGEVRFSSLETGYRRELLRCDRCGHFRSIANLAQPLGYGGEYVDSTYGSSDGMLRAFQRIVALDPRQSDNVGRVQRIVEYSKGRFAAEHGAPSVLDVGSGLCVFLHRMKEQGWRCRALDPDPRAAQHAREHVGIEAVCGDFMKVEELGQFDVVTFNKVLEHVEDPVAMLRRACGVVRPGGFVYIELPDGEAAAREGFHREEFFIDHLHVFSASSVATLAARAGFDLLVLERLREPSSKYTLRAFLAPSIG